ncbi:hypothetical protein BDW42DRAFT_131118 [Aspergillus taichungensis]|uniref:Uncharacterized protein n=1 Tax=Aspergillus taichungensis TaxID=482145 RepID=A0A2J5HPK7_9EURO|nr:hypothetical protein BDW42DRAFT_131118 [Aspergillus taichungensis]
MTVFGLSSVRDKESPLSAPVRCRIYRISDHQVPGTYLTVQVQVRLTPTMTSHRTHVVLPHR